VYDAPDGRRTWRPQTGLGWVALALAVGFVLVLLIAPYYLTEPVWLKIGVFVMAASVGAIGLNLLTGNTGQLSLAHAFFLAVGAYAFAFYAGGSRVSGGVEQVGLGLPAVPAAVPAVGTAGLAGLMFSPVATRLRGIYLGVASLSLVFLGQHLLFNLDSVTGGFNGRQAAAFTLPGLSFDDADPLMVGPVPYGRLEQTWYLFLVVLLLAYLFARNVLRSRTGRAMTMVRDSEVASSVMGIPVRRYKATAFVLSSVYAGVAGVMLMLVYGTVVVENFGLGLSIEYLAMIVIGGLGSVGGAVLGAAFVVATPLILDKYSSALPFLAEPGSGGVDPAIASRFLYGAAIILVVLLEPGGLAALIVRIRHRFAPGRHRPPAR
jgi:branched-chain amino acid transport system permease protein